jgi:hypothetical protein
MYSVDKLSTRVYTPYALEIIPLDGELLPSGELTLKFVIENTGTHDVNIELKNVWLLKITKFKLPAFDFNNIRKLDGSIPICGSFTPDSKVTLVGEKPNSLILTIAKKSREQMHATFKLTDKTSYPCNPEPSIVSLPMRLLVKTLGHKRLREIPFFIDLQRKSTNEAWPVVSDGPFKPPEQVLSIFSR